MHLFEDVNLEPKKGVFHIVIEIPKNSRIKYELDENHGVISIDRILRTPVAYPQNYGFFPQSWNKYDKDPMDGIVISNESIMPGVLAPVRIVGMIEMDDSGELDHKILSVLDGDPDFENVRDIDDLGIDIIENMEWFLANYKAREKGKEVKLLGRKNKKDAMKFLRDCGEEFANKQ